MILFMFFPTLKSLIDNPALREHIDQVGVVFYQS